MKNAVNNEFDNKLTVEEIRGIMDALRNSTLNLKYKIDDLVLRGVQTSLIRASTLGVDERPEEVSIHAFSPLGVQKYHELFLNLKDPKFPGNMIRNKDLSEILKTMDFTGVPLVRTKGLSAFNNISTEIEKYVCQNFDVPEYEPQRTETVFFGQYGNADVRYNDHGTYISLASPYTSFLHIKEIHPDLYILYTSFINEANSRKYGVLIVKLEQVENGGYSSESYMVPFSHLQAARRFIAERSIETLKYRPNLEKYGQLNYFINSDNLKFNDLNECFKGAV